VLWWALPLSALSGRGRRCVRKEQLFWSTWSYSMTMLWTAGQ